MNPPDRANNFDALRVVAATTVIFSHSFLIAAGNDHREPLVRLTGNQAVLGLAGVFVFFAISGYLVTQSWEQTRSPLRYLAKRALRIFPGLIAALVLSAFVLAPLVTTLPLADYLRRPEPYRYVIWNALLDVRVHELPGTMFIDNPVGLEVNGSLWTLRYEFEMYLMVMALGLAGLIRVPVLLALFALGIACIVVPGFDLLGGWGWMLSFFVAGMLIYKLRGTRIFAWPVVAAAAAGLVVGTELGLFIASFAACGTYLALRVALDRRLPVLPAARFGDLSYGLYIYGWPAEQAVVWSLGGHAPWWLVFALAWPLAATLAFASWHLIEKPALRLKPRARRAAPVPATIQPAV